MSLSRSPMTEFLAALVDIESVFPREEKLLLFLEKSLREAGLEPRRYPIAPDRWSIAAGVGRGSPVVCLNAHADTMPVNGESTPRARVEEGRLYGLGSCDDKASIAAIFTALKMLKAEEDGLRGRVEMLISVDEEADGQGVRTAVRDGYRCDYAIVGEATSLEILTVHGGILFLELETRGVSTHGSEPWNGVNAIEEMIALVEEIRAEVSLHEADAVIGRPSLNLGSVVGGDAANRVPDRCRALVDIRVVPPLSASEMLARVHAILAEPRWRGVSCRVYKQGDPFAARGDSRTVAALREAGREVLGEPLKTSGRRYWTEADPFRNLANADVVVCGAGNIRQAHSNNEFVELAEVEAAARIYTLAAKRLLGVGS